jgi:LysM repeat protein
MARPEAATEIARRDARRRLWAAGVCAAVVPLAACSAASRHVAKSNVSATTVAATTTTTAPPVTYRVKRGDTLGGIAKRLRGSRSQLSPGSTTSPTRTRSKTARPS